MGAGAYDIRIDQGSTFRITIDIKDSTGAGVSLTGASIAGKIKKKYTDKDALVSFTFTLANQTTNAGRFTMSLTNTQTAALAVLPSSANDRPDTKYLYDVEVTWGSGEVERIMQGFVLLSPEVTK